MYRNGNIRYVFMPDRSGIYRMINMRTGESYIGATRSFIKRMRTHATRMFQNNAQYALNKAPVGDEPDVFFAEILEYCERVALAAREAFWIDLMKPSLNTIDPNRNGKFESSPGNQARLLLRDVKASCLGEVA
jgi:group I intron endonuclease